MNELFSDAEAARMIEAIHPELGIAIRQLVLADETPSSIVQAVRIMISNGLIRSLIGQAVHHYIELRKPIGRDDGIVTHNGIAYRYNVVDNHGVARWQCHEYVTEEKPTYRESIMEIKKWIVAQ
jgi:hypothetical protein